MDAPDEDGKEDGPGCRQIVLVLVSEGSITEEEAVMRVDPTSLDQVLHKHIDPEAHIDVLVRGIAASPGAAVGKAIFDTNKGCPSLEN